MNDANDYFASRLEIPVFPISIPETGRGKRREIAGQIVRGMYPASLEGKRIVLRRNGARGSYLAFVVDNTARSGLFRSSTLYAERLARRTGLRDGELIVLDATYEETITFSSGSVASTVARFRGESSRAESARRNAKDAGSRRTASTGDIVILCDRADASARSQAERSGIVTRFFPEGFVSIVTEAWYSLHPLNARFVRATVALSLVIALLLASFAVTRVADRAVAAARVAEEKRVALEREKAESARRETLRAEYDRLLAEYTVRVLTRPHDPYSTLSLVHDAIGNEPKVRKIEIKDNDIAVSLVTGYSVPVVASLERNPYICDLSFQDYGADRTKPGLFITASVRYPKLREEEGNLPEKIANLRERLSELSDRDRKMPSLVSGYFDGLVTRARDTGCSLERVESLEEGGYVALSFLARGTARSVLRFLKDTSTGASRFVYRSASVEYFRESASVVLTGVILTGIKAEATDRETSSELILRSARKSPADLTGLFYRADIAAANDGLPKGPRRETTRERATWLRYMGYIRDGNEESLYLRNERDGSTLRVGRSSGGSDGVIGTTSGEIELLLGGSRYVIER